MNLDSISDWVRTHYTGQVSSELDGQEVTLFGWVQDIRDLGGIRFIILQDREGTIQLTIPKKRILPEVLTKSDLLQKRFSLGVKGNVKKTNMTPRGIEVIPSAIKIFNIATEQLPIDITGKTPALIESRLDARPLDLTQEKSIATSKSSIRCSKPYVVSYLKESFWRFIRQESLLLQPRVEQNCSVWIILGKKPTLRKARNSTKKS